MPGRANETLSMEEHILPSTKEGFLSLLRSVVEAPGAVERILMEVNQPVRVFRWVEKNDLIEEDATLDVLLSRVSMLEHVQLEDEDPYQTTWQLLHKLRMEHMHPVAWVTGPAEESLLEKWYRLKGVPTLEWSLGIPVQRLRSLPVDTLLLCGAPFTGAAPKDITFAIRTAIQLRRPGHAKQNGGDDDQSRDRPEERSAADGALESSGRRHFRTGWNPFGVTRK